jgi:hypothetical protein
MIKAGRSNNEKTLVNIVSMSIHFIPQAFQKKR